MEDKNEPTEFKVQDKEEILQEDSSQRRSGKVDETSLPSPSNLVSKRLMSRMSEKEKLEFRSSEAMMDNFEKIMRNNKIWARSVQEEEPGFF